MTAKDNNNVATIRQRVHIGMPNHIIIDNSKKKRSSGCRSAVQ